MGSFGNVTIWIAAMFVALFCGITTGATPIIDWSMTPQVTERSVDMDYNSERGITMGGDRRQETGVRRKIVQKSCPGGKCSRVASREVLKNVKNVNTKEKGVRSKELGGKRQELGGKELRRAVKKLGVLIGKGGVK